MNNRTNKSKMHYRKFCTIMASAFGIALILFLIINIVVPDRGFSEKENRVLSSSPDLSLSQLASGRFERNYETYVNDQFVFRDLWVNIKAAADRLLGFRESNGVFACKGGRLAEAFAPGNDETIDNTVSSMIGLSQRYPDIPQYALIAPTAVNILDHTLPAHVPTTDQNIYLDDLYARLGEAGIQCIDVRSTLEDHSSEDIYYRTDHHWTTRGAYYAFEEAADAIGFIPIYDYEPSPVTYAFQGTLSAKSGFNSGEKEEMDVYLPIGDVPQSVVNYVEQQKKVASFYDTAQLEGRDKYAMFFGGNHALVKISTPVEDSRTLLVIKDSYANCLVPFLAPYYRSIILVDPRYYFGDLEQLIAVEEVQEILYLYNANTFFSDTSLNVALTPSEGSLLSDAPDPQSILDNAPAGKDDASSGDTASENNTASDSSGNGSSDAVDNDASSDNGDSYSDYGYSGYGYSYDTYDSYYNYDTYS